MKKSYQQKAREYKAEIRKIERASRIFWTVFFLALVGFIAGAIYGWADLISAQILEAVQ